MYPLEQVSKFVQENFVPVKIHVRERPKDFERFKAEWTPTLIVAEPDGTERYRFSGYLPGDDFLAQLKLGLAKAAFSRSQFIEAEGAFRQLAEEHPGAEVAPEALYWATVSVYKGFSKGEALRDGGLELQKKYPESAWTKKASVWVH